MSIDDRIRSGLTANADLPPPPVERHLAAAGRRHRRHAQVRVAALVLVLLVLLTAPVVVVRAVDGNGLEPAPPNRPGVPGTYRVAVRGSGETATMTGAWRVSLGADGSITLEAPRTYAGPTAGEGEAYDLDGDQLTTNLFLGWPGCQRAEPPVGSYRVSPSDDGLELERVVDLCPPRVLLFGSSWERQP